MGCPPSHPQAALEPPLEHARFSYGDHDATSRLGRLGRTMPVMSRAVVAAAMVAVLVIQALDQVGAHWQRVIESRRKQFSTAVPVMEAGDDGLA